MAHGLLTNKRISNSEKNKVNNKTKVNKMTDTNTTEKDPCVINYDAIPEKYPYIPKTRGVTVLFLEEPEFAYSANPAKGYPNGRPMWKNVVIEVLQPEKMDVYVLDANKEFVKNPDGSTQTKNQVVSNLQSTSTWVHGCINQIDNNVRRILQLLGKPTSGFDVKEVASLGLKGKAFSVVFGSELQVRTTRDGLKTPILDEVSGKPIKDMRYNIYEILGRAEKWDQVQAVQ